MIEGPNDRFGRDVLGEEAEAARMVRLGVTPGNGDE